jgi:two-component system sensor histidine kinase YesM
MKKKTILKLLLQPLVENALYHGIKNKRGKGTIKVRGWQEGGFLCFSVEDNGIGMTGEQLDTIGKHIKQHSDQDALHAGYGLYNVSKRLELYYNRQALLEIKSVYQQGTLVMLKIPGAEQNV